MPLLSAKFFMPPPAAKALKRTALLDFLQQAHSKPLIILQAAAGFGKTTLLAHWLSELGTQEYATWLTLDPADADVGRFLTYWIYALRRLSPYTQAIGQQALEALAARQTHQPLDLENILASVCDELALPETQLTCLATEPPFATTPYQISNDTRPPPRYLVVLDDAQVIQAPALAACIEFLLQALPPNVTLILASRLPLPLPLGRLAARQAVAILDESALAFTETEIQQLAQAQAGCVYRSEILTEIAQKTAGWPAAVALLFQAQAHMHAQDQTQPISTDEVTSAESIRHLLAHPPEVLVDFLLQDIFAHLPEDLQHFIWLLTHFDLFCADLLDAVCRASHPPLPTGNAQRLQVLQQQGLWLVAQDAQGQWFKLHPLSQALLTHAQPAPTHWSQTQLCQFYQAASRWYASQAHMRAALEYALAAQDTQGVLYWVQQAYPSYLVTQDLARVLAWRLELPESIWETAIHLHILYTWALACAGQLDMSYAQVQKLLADAEIAPANAGQLGVIQAQIAQGRGDLATANQLALEAYHRLNPHLAVWQFAALSLLTENYTRLKRFKSARGYNRAAQALAHKTQQVELEQKALVDYIALELAKGHMQALDAPLAQGLALAQAYPQQARQASYGRLLVYQAYRKAGQGQLQSACVDLNQALPLLKRTRDLFSLAAYLLLADIEVCYQRPEQAFVHLSQAERLMHIWDVPSIYYLAWITVSKAQLWIDEGKYELAETWLLQIECALTDNTVKPPNYLDDLDERVRALRLRLAILQQKNQQVHTLLAQLTPMKSGVQGLASQLQQALFLWQQEDFTSAYAHLDFLLIQMQTQMHYWPLLNAEPQLVRMLEEYPKKRPAYTWLQQQAWLLEKWQHKKPTQTPKPSVAKVEPLSQREAKVLALAAQGLSNQAIAERLFISLHTVKTHMRHILRKLDARSRMQAVQKARVLGWFQ
ncbi:LuxR family transcriptional regulator, maltose regulon positive regulatory protein [Allopseudospirillum japonicum]|uniref:LuxR family transcriptional regulator, maltose regulon positive regulatory protein n=1 Tax=Allopseudospirillum japonicum TaxID=64971 RepID=A0A1H6TIT5_9GAMM|nr:LuxR C-terminal-related transcriptional regulator [Allopseudospirillum japonicum]SEI79216.1 LuxR family transcriptional regulator, maltose regulon positive regulatory protein [Allopseudospirillum japonicum]